MIRVLVTDDHPIVRDGLKYVMSQHPDMAVVGEAEDGAGVLRLVKQVEADVVLLDVSMPGPGVLELIRRIKELRTKIRVVVLSVYPEQLYARRVLKAGADGYLTKNHSSRALAGAIRQVYKGTKYVSSSLAQEFAATLTRDGEGPLHEQLSNREYQVFLQLGSGRRIGEIAEDLKLSAKTVRTYRDRVLEKMNLRTTAQLILYAVQQGLVTDVSDRSKADASSGPSN